MSGKVTLSVAGLNTLPMLTVTRGSGPSGSSPPWTGTGRLAVAVPVAVTLAQVPMLVIASKNSPTRIGAVVAAGLRIDATTEAFALAVPLTMSTPMKPTFALASMSVAFTCALPVICTSRTKACDTGVAVSASTSLRPSSVLAVLVSGLDTKMLMLAPNMSPAALNCSLFDTSEALTPVSPALVSAALMLVMSWARVVLAAWRATVTATGCAPFTATWNVASADNTPLAGSTRAPSTVASKGDRSKPSVNCRRPSAATLRLLLVLMPPSGSRFRSMPTGRFWLAKLWSSRKKKVSWLLDGL